TDSGLWFAELISELLSLLTPSNIPKPSLNLDPSTVRMALKRYSELISVKAYLISTAFFV
ncbi:MAG: hypothetical protein WBD30_11410, partial [Bacteroidota bacterium]